MTPGEKLRAWRVAKGLSQAAAAKLAGLTNQARWSRIEAGEGSIWPDEALRIERLTGGAVPSSTWERPSRVRTAAEPNKKPRRKRAA